MLSNILFRYTQIFIRKGIGIQIQIQIQIISSHYNWAWISHKYIKPQMEIELKRRYGLDNLITIDHAILRLIRDRGVKSTY